MWASMPTSKNSGNNQIFSLAMDEGFCVRKTTCIKYLFKFQRTSIGNDHLSISTIQKFDENNDFLSGQGVVSSEPN